MEISVKFLKFLYGFLAVIGFLTLLIIGLIVQGVTSSQQSVPQLESNSVLVVDFRNPITEKADNNPFASFEAPKPTLHQIRDAIDAAATDTRITALVGIFGYGQFGLAEIEELAPTLEKFRATEKRMVAYSSDYAGYGGSSSNYIMASYFKEVTLQPMGMVALTGPAIQSPYLGKALENFGLNPEFERRSEFKTAMNFLVEEEMPLPERKMLSSLLVDLNAQIIKIVAKNRDLAEEDIQKILEDAPHIDAKALASKLIDRLTYYEELSKEFNLENEQKTVNAAGYLNRLNSNQIKDVAVILAEGPIIDGGAGNTAFNDQSLTPQQIRAAAEEILKNKAKYKGVILRVNSPGGSAIASESIRHTITKLQENGLKVVVSMGNSAASGGYWISTDADHIIAHEATLTGSIGVISGKISAETLLEDLDVKVDEIKLYENSTIWSPLKSFSEQQKYKHKEMTTYIYQSFLNRVSEGRNLPIEKVAQIAKGRVYTGSQALELGLIDELGGLETALQKINQLDGATDESKSSFAQLDYFPRKVDPFEMFLENFVNQISLGNKLNKIAIAAEPMLQQYQTIIAPPGQAHMPYQIQQ